MDLVERHWVDSGDLALGARVLELSAQVLVVY